MTCGTGAERAKRGGLTGDAATRRATCGLTSKVGAGATTALAPTGRDDRHGFTDVTSGTA